MMEASVRKLFGRFENFFNRSLGGDVDMDEVASLYASEFFAMSTTSSRSWTGCRRFSAGCRAMSKRR